MGIGCKFCYVSNDGDSDLNEIFSFQKDWMRVGVASFSDGIELAVWREDVNDECTLSEKEIGFNYCPMCGRALRDKLLPIEEYDGWLDKKTTEKRYVIADVVDGYLVTEIVHNMQYDTSEEIEHAIFKNLDQAERYVMQKLSEQKEDDNGGKTDR